MFSAQTAFARSAPGGVGNDHGTDRAICADLMQDIIPVNLDS